MTWLCRPDFAAALPLLDIASLRRPEALPSGQLVKDNPVRTVVRLPDPLGPHGPGLFVKRYKFRGLRDRLKHLFVPTKPDVEWRVGRALEASGIRTAGLLAMAVRREGRAPVEGFLVSREIPDAVRLKDLLRGRPAPIERMAPAFRHELIEELAELTAELANGSFHHRDYHAGNLLVRPQSPPGERLYVVDLHRIGRRLGRPQLLHMLAMLSWSTDRPAVRHEDRMEFLRALLPRWRGALGREEDAERWAADVKAAEAILRRRGARSRTRRCMVKGSIFTMEEADGYLVHRRRDFSLEAALGAVRLHDAAVRGAPDAGTGAGAPEVLRHGARTQVTVCPCGAVPPFTTGRPARPDRIGPGRVCVKSFLRASLYEKLKDSVRRLSRARAAWIVSHGLDVRGVPAARPLALLEARGKWSGRPDYLIMEALENDGTLGELARRAPSGPERRALAAAVARLLNLMAQSAVYHPDTKPNNLLVKEMNGPRPGFRLYLVDLDRVEFDSPMTRGRWVKALARLNAGLPAQITLLDRMRCLRECGRGRWNARRQRRIAREVYALSLRRRPAWREAGGRPG